MINQEPPSQEHILKVIGDDEAEQFFYFEFNDLKNLKLILRKNKKIKTFGDFRKSFIKEYGFKPSILMLCFLNPNDKYQDYFKSRYQDTTQEPQAQEPSQAIIIQDTTQEPQKIKTICNKCETEKICINQSWNELNL